MNEKAIKFYQELKKTRNSKKITLKEISEYTKINAKYLEALENGNFNILPNVYTRLFLRSYCNYLAIDYKAILDEYEIYTLGHKQREIIADSDLEDKDTDDKESFEINSISSKAKDYKEIIIAIAVIITIILLFTIINNFN